MENSSDPESTRPDGPRPKAADKNRPPTPPAKNKQASDRAVVISAGDAKPSPSPGHWAQAAEATAVQTNTLRIEVDDKDYVFHPGQEALIGRGQDCNVVLDKRHSLASRNHVKASFRDGDWWLEDFSTKGTYVDGSKIRKPYKAQGGFKALLGNKQAGTEIKIVAPGEHVDRSRKKFFVWGAIGTAVLLLAVGLGSATALGAFSDPTTTTLSDSELASIALNDAKRSAVQIFNNGSSEGVSRGSGFFVSDTLIVTNQHVVEEDDQLEIAVTVDIDQPVQPAFVGEVLDRHPFLDVAVIRLTGRLQEAGEGAGDPNNFFDSFTIAELGEVNNSSATVGESDEILGLGDTIFTTGFPGILAQVSQSSSGGISLPPVSTDEGQAGSFTIWPGCSNPDQESLIPAGGPPTVRCNDGGDIANAIIVTTFASGPGGSGSPVYKGDMVIGIHFAGPPGEANVGLSIATSQWKDWLDAIIAAN